MRNLTFWNREPNYFFNHLFDSPLFDRTEEEKSYRPFYDVEEDEERYVVNVDVPGVPKKNVNIEVKDRLLTISGERKGYKFERILSLPADVDVEQITAHYEDGVLSVELAKAATAKSRQIKIGEGKPTLLGKLRGNHTKEEAEKAA